MLSTLPNDNISFDRVQKHSINAFHLPTDVNSRSKIYLRSITYVYVIDISFLKDALSACQTTSSRLILVNGTNLSLIKEIFDY